MDDIVRNGGRRPLAYLLTMIRILQDVQTWGGSERDEGMKMNTVENELMAYDYQGDGPRSIGSAPGPDLRTIFK